MRKAAADHVRRQVAAAQAAGATQLVDHAQFGAADAGVYLAPQVLVGVDHSMALMREETFGPVVGIMAVDDDDEAVRLMNDSRYGLTASVWTPTSRLQEPSVSACKRARSSPTVVPP